MAWLRYFRCTGGLIHCSLDFVGGSSSKVVGRIIICLLFGVRLCGCGEREFPRSKRSSMERSRRERPISHGFFRNALSDASAARTRHVRGRAHIARLAQIFLQKRVGQLEFFLVITDSAPFLAFSSRTLRGT